MSVICCVLLVKLLTGSSRRNFTKAVEVPSSASRILKAIFQRCKRGHFLQFGWYPWGKRSDLEMCLRQRSEVHIKFWKSVGSSLAMVVCLSECSFFIALYCIFSIFKTLCYFVIGHFSCHGLYVWKKTRWWWIGLYTRVFGGRHRWICWKDCSSWQSASSTRCSCSPLLTSYKQFFGCSRDSVSSAHQLLRRHLRYWTVSFLYLYAYITIIVIFRSKIRSQLQPVI